MTTPETVRYDADGLAMAGELFLPARIDGARPGVLVFPDASGLNAHARERAARLASLGYVALACDLHGGGTQMTDFDAAIAAVRALRETPARIRARAGGALAALVARPEVDAARTAAIGFCFGGTMALELARDGAALLAVVGFHSGLATQRPAETGVVRARVLACIGADDPSIPPAQRAAFEQEMTAARADWQLHTYGGVVHSFTERDVELRTGHPERTRYDAAADARSWAAMRQLFAESLDAPRA
ncbi:dienelactone hydrolase family protein [Roseisolibacter agri]|uniref:Dienelactone hydrolase n=1 Tax=Roseisolibacter agri TaxID=2014610 RepID=A0AA37V179_9BACT|nr:dienelactone hydrolase family protein [Roseisolibacter agri]GLC25750.1 dienelactone hydrolase [Roseisolibacter agri]